MKRVIVAAALLSAGSTAAQSADPSCVSATDNRTMLCGAIGTDGAAEWRAGGASFACLADRAELNSATARVE